MYVLVCGTFISDRSVSDHMQIVTETALRFLVTKNKVLQRNMFRNSGFRSVFLGKRHKLLMKEKAKFFV